MGVPTAEEEESKQSSEPNSPTMPSEMENDDMLSDYPRKKKMFSSSSFYEEPNAIYPTVEEQVEMCRKIADSLSDDCNKKSRGANMFFKRVKKAEKWVVESTAFYENETQMDSFIGSLDPSKMPYVRISKDPPKLKLILDPRHIVDMKRLKQEGVNIVEHNAVSPEICHDLVKDLNSPTGRGAQLFAKRKKKSEEWVVDEEKVKALLRERSAWDGGILPDGTLPIKPLTHPRVQMIKTPWSAAMESPIGSCDGAFRAVDTNEVVDSVIRAAEAKIMTYPSPRYSAIEPLIQYEPPSAPSTPLPPLQRLASMPSLVQAPSSSSSALRPDVYKSRVPKGWTRSPSSHSSALEPSSSKTEEPPYLLSRSPTMALTSQDFPTSRTFNFANFNKTAKAWLPDGTNQLTQVKPVKPPSVLLVQ